MTPPYRCPVNHDPLMPDGADALVSRDHRRRYPIIDGVPILLPDRDQIDRLVAASNEPSIRATQREPPTDNQPLHYYNRDALHEGYYDTGDQTHTRDQVAQWIARTGVTGPTLEIGSGQGQLQGLGDHYIALDYSLSSLRRYIDANRPRVCGDAANLPFADASIGFVFTVDCLEHVPAADRAMAEIDRVLRPGGVAFILPAWHCTQYNCEGLRVRPYRDLTLRQRAIKTMIPLLRSKIWKAATTLPQRFARRMAWQLAGRSPTRMHLRRLTPDYQHRWNADSDAISRLDAHEGALFFASRRYTLLTPAGGWLQQLLLGHEPVVVQKPADIV